MLTSCLSEQQFGDSPTHAQHPHQHSDAHANPLVTVITPSFNRGPFLLLAIDTLLKQTYTNWECLIVDNGSSKEDTFSALDQIEQMKDPRIQVHRLHTDYVNPSIPRNYAFELMKGDFVTFLDDDDIW